METNNNKESGANHFANITGNASGVQIQQNVSHSFQTQITNEDFDYEIVLEILKEISKYEPMFKDTYGNTAEQALEALNKAKAAIVNKEQPSRIKGFLNVLKDVSLRVSSSLIATGILGLLSQVGI